MTDPVADAVRRFRRRLTAATTARVALSVCAAGALLVAGSLLALRFVFEVDVSAVPWWLTWALLPVVGLASGALVARRRALDRGAALAHLERRLGTDGLLLAAVDAPGFDDGWQRRLAPHLARVDAALPRVRLGALSTRPALAGLVLLVVQLLPAPDPRAAGAGAATRIAVERLADAVEQVVELPTVTGEQRAELRRELRELQRRVAQGDADLWRDIDRLREHLGRERELAAAAGREGGSPSAEQLAGAAELLARQRDATGDDPLARAAASLPEELAAALRAAERPDGSFDPAALPDDAEALQRIGDALAQAAGPGDRGDGAMERASNELGRDLLAAAAELGAAGGEVPELPPWLQQAMAEAAAGMLENLDLEALAGLLPDDPEQLRHLAETLRGALAEPGAGDGEAAAAAAAAFAGMSAEQRQRFAKLGAGLAQQLQRMDGLDQVLASVAGGRASGSTTGRSDSGSGDAAASGTGGADVGADGGGQTTGGALDGGGHTPLRRSPLPDTSPDTSPVTEGATLTLPPAAPDAPLPTEWQPWQTRKAEPERLSGDAGSGAGPDGPGRAGADAGERGASTWRQRLSPRHRDVVRRYFGDDEDK